MDLKKNEVKMSKEILLLSYMFILPATLFYYYSCMFSNLTCFIICGVFGRVSTY